jgi:hypothetical protein
MAAPAVAGISALLAQVYRLRPSVEAARAQPALGQAFNPRPNDDILRSDMLKAALVHTSDRASKSKLGPTYCAGWGKVDARKAGHAIAGIKGKNLLTLLDDGKQFPVVKRMQTNEFSRRAGEGGIRVTLVWIDPPALPNNSGRLDDPRPMLVNNLDLRLRSQSGRLFFPWTLQRDLYLVDARRCEVSPAEEVADRCRNHLDNVEVVDVDPARSEPGEWTIEVSAAPNVKEQAFALVISGLE